MVKMMSILKKIKLALLASAVMLSPQWAYAIDPSSEDLRGCKPLASPRVMPFEGEASSSQGVDPAIQKTIFIPRISKDKLEDISARMSTNGAILKILETRNLGKTVEIPQTSPQKKEKPNGEMGAEESIQFSVPSTTKKRKRHSVFEEPNGEMEAWESEAWKSIQISLPSTTIKMETPQRFEESLPAIFLEFSERYIILRQEITEEEELETFNDLYRSFIDVVQLYKIHYPEFNPYFGIVSKDPEDPKRYQSFMALAKIYQSYYPDSSTEKPAF
jgi:hypothetical protein